MDDELRKIYDNPETTSNNPRQLWLRVDRKYTQKAIKEWLDKQEEKQIFGKQNVDQKKIVANTDRSFQIDLTFFEQFKVQNSYFVGLLTAINVGSRKGYAYPIKNKSQQEIDRVLQKLMTDGKPDTITSDNEKSFINFFKRQKGVKHFLADPDRKGQTSVIERFNRTLRDKITRYQKSFRTKRYIDVLPKLLKNYNSSYHSSIGMEPEKVTSEDQIKFRMESASENANVNSREPPLNVGDKVRLLKKRSLFEKGTQTFTRGIYTITEINQNHFILKNPRGVVLKTKYQRYELKLVPPDTHVPERQKKDSTREIQSNTRTQRRNKRQNFIGVEEFDSEGNPIFVERQQPRRNRREQQPTRRFLEFMQQ